jgi:hypothetical protein
MSQNVALLTVIGAVAAVIVSQFFFWLGSITRAFSGHAIENLTVGLHLKRRPRESGGVDDLVVTITLEKLAAHGISLRSLRVEIFSLDSQVFGQAVVGCRPKNSLVWVPEPSNRSLNASGRRDFERFILAIWTDEEERPLNLAPGEGTEYGAYCVVPSNTVFEVIVMLTGFRYRYPWVRRLFNALKKPHLLFWTASAISLPKTNRVD